MSWIPKFLHLSIRKASSAVGLLQSQIWSSKTETEVLAVAVGTYLLCAQEAKICSYCSWQGGWLCESSFVVISGYFRCIKTKKCGNKNSTVGICIWLLLHRGLKSTCVFDLTVFEQFQPEVEWFSECILVSPLRYEHLRAYLSCLIGFLYVASWVLRKSAAIRAAMEHNFWKLQNCRSSGVRFLCVSPGRGIPLSIVMYTVHIKL